MGATSVDADVLIAGGGPVGSTLALLLRRAGLRVTIVERSRFPRDKACGEGLLPSGAAVLADLGIDLASEGFPMVGGVGYRIPGGPAVSAGFRDRDGRSVTGFGVRRTRFDALLHERALGAGAAVHTECRLTGYTVREDRVLVETDRGALTGSWLVGADGARSDVRRLAGWARPPSRRARYALVGHPAVTGGLDQIVVTVAGDHEVYAAPTGPAEVLAVVLGRKGHLRAAGFSVGASYRAAVESAHPEWRDAAIGAVTGAGPFGSGTRRAAGGRVFLAGDAAGFTDPLTGDGISAGLAAASRLADLLACGPDPGRAAVAYRAWHRRRWITRRSLAAVALALSTSPRLADRALRGLGGRPGALEALLQVAAGSRPLTAVPATAWAALAGI